MKLLVKQIKRLSAQGFKSLRTYRLRVLLQSYVPPIEWELNYYRQQLQAA
jgi:hypothetical protein